MTNPASGFTNEQRSAVEYRQLDVCVTAGPGSGKTTVLVERYRELVMSHGFAPHEILAITFTEKAAANMKSKLAELFRHSPERLREFESSAWVSTIHGFCVRLLREHAIDAGLDPRFSVLSPGESERLQWECLHAALDEFALRRRAETLELIEALQAPSLAGHLKDAYEAMRSAGVTVSQVREMPNPATPAPASEIPARLRALLAEWPLRLTPSQSSQKDRLLDWCQEFESAGDLDFPAFLELSGRLAINLKGVPRACIPALRAFRDAPDGLSRYLAAAVDRYAAPFRALIFDILERFDEEYRNRRKARGKVDFNDLERLAIALLRGHSAVRGEVHRQFRQIMLDEFQDINGQQNELISLLRAENVFFGVGDRNQSIYGFRHARPELFLAYRREVMERQAQSVALAHNFRSRAAILSFVRDVLSGAEGIEDRELHARANFAGKDEPSVEVLKVILRPELAAEGTADSSGDGEADDKDAARGREAEWIAHRIRQMHGAVWLGEPGQTRPAAFRDFAVLCRTGVSMHAVLAAFDRAGIPYVSGQRQSFLVSREGRDITALLGVIANPRDTISLATVLRSPFVGLSDDGLLRARLLARGLSGGLNRFAAGSQPGTAADAGLSPEAGPPLPLSAPDAALLRAFCRNLERWRQDQFTVPLDILISRALTDCGQSWVPGSRPGTSAANIESFLHLARTAGAAMDLPSFLLEIENQSDAAGNEADLSDEDQGDRVQVMTTHAAKGLEFPVTIVAAMDKGPRRESPPVTFTVEYGIGVKWRNPLEGGAKGFKDSWAEASKAVLRARENDEENRLLYVAMTRAQEHLILSYSTGKSRPSGWAGLIDRHFNLHPPAPSPGFVVEKRDGYEASILVTDADAPALYRPREDPASAGLPVIARAAAEDQHETAVTVTSLTVFGDCPRKYYIQRSLGWNTGRFRRFDPDDAAESEPADGDDGDHGLSAAQLGSVVHEILAGSAPPAPAPEARRLAEVFLRGHLGRRVAASPRVEREWAFIAEIDGTILRGSVDLWFEENGELHVVDYKTDDVSAAEAPDRALGYAPQLALYAVAIERATGVRPRAGWLHFLRPDVVVEIALDGETVHAARALIGALRQAQNDLRFDLHEGAHCRACQFYRSLCPAGWHPGGGHNES